MDKIIDRYVDSWIILDEIVIRTREKESKKIQLTDEELDEIDKANKERLDLFDDITQMGILSSVTVRYNEKSKLKNN